MNGFSNTIGSLSGNGIVNNGGSTNATLTVGNDNTNTTFGGTLKDGNSPLGLTKVGTGTLTLTGANTYTAGTTISGGTLQLGNGEPPEALPEMSSTMGLWPLTGVTP